MQRRQVRRSAGADVVVAAIVSAGATVICQTIHTVVDGQIVVDVRLRFANARR